MKMVNARRLAPIGASALLVLMLPGAASFGAESPLVDETLCEAISADELNALSVLAFEQVHGDERSCNFWPAGAGSGEFGVFLRLDRVEAIDAARQNSADAQDAQVGDYTGVVFETKRDGTFALLDLGDVSLVINAEIAGWPEADGVDPAVLALDIANVAITNLTDESGGGGTEAGDDAATADDLLPLPEIEAVSWDRERTETGLEIQEAGNEDQMGFFAPLLESVGASFPQMIFRQARVVDTSTSEPLGEYLGVTVVGVDQAVLESAAISWLESQIDPDLLVTKEEVTLAGKPVTRFGSEEEQVFVFVSGDTIHLLPFADAVAAAIVERLP